MIMLRPDLQDCTSPKFAPGDLVCHVRYLYRGVVVAYDPKCLADENWYKSNKNRIYSLTGTNLGTMCSFMNPDP